ncbi:hypothetical protein E1A91_A08G050700v1 [Gossypium mustelinum]|uniref:Uncharacterized protein n=1 Tax=Gossypium mustelinum TaxID=34275 RepID=A0A5D2Y4Q3_GOSMU|nr:hypothetical protein E1A91_A08G050700v1 [Gossypium mustelinum]
MSFVAIIAFWLRFQSGKLNHPEGEKQTIMEYPSYKFLHFWRQPSSPLPMPFLQVSSNYCFIQDVKG